MRLLLLSLFFIVIFAACAPSEPIPLPEGNAICIVSRAEWHALPSLDTTGANRYALPLNQVLRAIAVHHTTMVDDSPLLIQRYHMTERHYDDIAYHFLIGNDGRIYEGRAIDERGAHVAGCNNGTIGIAVCGNMETQPPSKVQLQSLSRLVAHLTATYGVTSLGGHRDFPQANTLCPGKHLLPILNELRIVYGLEKILR